ncbi:MAG: permease-like cell division protein FtsX [Lachnospiraceae bacterium]|nr:permease-like cell division protein FtsX [Lachnospiraceae bacterium]
MNKNDMLLIKNAIAMPAGLADTLTQNCTSSRTKRPLYTRYPRTAAVLIAAVAILISGTTSFAYNIYQEKNLAVFMESGLSQAEIDRIGEQLSQIYGVSSCRFISGDEAWNEFTSTYLDAELTASFTDNPLKDSFNYRLGVRLDANTEKVREEISKLAGVRLVQNLEELKK